MGEETKVSKPKKSKAEVIELILKALLYLAILAFILLGIFAERLFGGDNIFTQNIGSIFNVWNNFDETLPLLLLSISYSTFPPA